MVCLRWGVVALCLVAGTVSAQVVPAGRMARLGQNDEGEGGARPPVLEQPAVSDWAPPDSMRFGPGFVDRSFGITQVNVSASGLNILGDAANEPSIAIDPTAPNRMVIGWRQFNSVNSDFRQAGNAWSNDGGRTWHNRTVFTPGTFRSDPTLDADANGLIYYSSLKSDFTVDMFISPTGGQTWQSPVPVPGGDKQWIVIDRTGGIGNGNIYQSWSTAAGCCDSRIFTRSVDGGHTWMNPTFLPSSPVWGSMAVRSDGTLFVVGYSFNDGNVWVLRSTNAKYPTLTPSFTSTIVDMGGVFDSSVSCDPNPAGLIGTLWIGVDNSGGPYDGRVYVVASVDPPGSDQLDVRCAISTNGGVTFGSSRRINDDASAAGNYQWFGTMSVAPNGRLDVVWNDTRNSGVCNRSQLYYSYSEDGGSTWAANQIMSPEWNSHVGWPVQQKIGDYYHMRSDLLGADLAFAATFNNEEDVYHLRIGPSDCNGNGIDDSLDISGGNSRDCNGNDIPDECDIAAGLLEDANGNGIADICDCPADITNDGVLDFFDVAEFLDLFSAHNPLADWTGEGAFDFFDVAAFLDAFSAGCP